MDTIDFEELCGFDPAGKTRRQLEAALERCGRVTSFVASKKLATLAALAGLADDGAAPADANRATTRESSQASKRAAATADQIVAMPALREALETGEISPEHADAAAAAAQRVSPEAADEALSKLATQLPADRFAKKAASGPVRTKTRPRRNRVSNGLAASAMVACGGRRTVASASSPNSTRLPATPFSAPGKRR